jgi:hypothetical protein
MVVVGRDDGKRRASPGRSGGVVWTMRSGSYGQARVCDDSGAASARDRCRGCSSMGDEMECAGVGRERLEGEAAIGVNRVYRR